jgi:8-oxo-dGTP pyrophosphatase MutT (NUDIX family)
MKTQDLSRRWRDLLSLRTSAAPAARQSGAIPYRIGQGQPVFLIITSRGTGRWIFPKGTPIDGKLPWEVASVEALEEAGVEGDVETQPVGSYRTVKMVGISRMPVEVDMFPMRVERQHEDWLEKDSRERQWVSLQEATRLLSVPRLAQLAALVSRRALSGR